MSAPEPQVGPVGAADASRFVAQLVGQRAWGAKLGFGTMATIELGDVVPARKEGDKPHGTFHLWLYDCAWSLSSRAGGFLSGSLDDDLAETGKALAQLDGKHVVAATLVEHTLCVVFEDGYVLQAFAAASHDRDHWTLFLADRRTLTLGQGLQYLLEAP